MFREFQGLAALLKIKVVKVGTDSLEREVMG